jgi:CDGSH-type Zn-finger protein/mannose-6-phosphate isomerase-like protein (cupin superfamily)
MSDHETNTPEPEIAAYKPCLTALQEGKRYFWCTCGRSKQQPFCDGSHAGTPFKPLMFVAEKTEEVLLCACKRTRSGPFCDGAHNNLQDTYEEASADEIAAMGNAKLIERDASNGGKVMLDGGAYVLTPDARHDEHKGSLAYQTLIGPQDGANHISLLRFIASPGTSPWRRQEDADTVLFVVSGTGVINIENKAFSVGPETGIFVQAGEAFRIETQETLTLMAIICPQSDAAFWPENADGTFHKVFSERRVGVDHDKASVMADRFFQILVDEQIGSKEITQFIGEVPLSRAAFHRHLYEEAILILSGEGMMWTENCRAPVKPGDIIFLAKRQGHSLECTDPGGLRLMGAFYPAGSPAINY